MPVTSSAVTAAAGWTNHTLNRELLTLHPRALSCAGRERLRVPDLQRRQRPYAAKVPGSVDGGRPQRPALHHAVAQLALVRTRQPQRHARVARALGHGDARADLRLDLHLLADDELRLERDDLVQLCTI